MDKKRIEALRKIYECKDPSKKVVLVKGKKINESDDYRQNPVAVDVFDDLLDRAESNYDGDLEEAVRVAIDDGLIYTEDQLALMNRYMSASEISDIFFNYCNDLLFDELLDALEERVEEADTDESLKEDVEKVDVYKDVDFSKITDKGEKDNRDLWSIVYDEIFKAGNKSRNYYASEEEYKADTDEYEGRDNFFDPKKKRETANLDVLKNNEGIGIGHANNLERLKKIAKKFKLKYILGKRGDSIIILIPDEFIQDHKGSLRYINSIGLKTFRSEYKKKNGE